MRNMIFGAREEGNLWKACIEFLFNLVFLEIMFTNMRNLIFGPNWGETLEKLALSIFCLNFVALERMFTNTRNVILWARWGGDLGEACIEILLLQLGKECLNDIWKKPWISLHWDFSFEILQLGKECLNDIWKKPWRSLRWDPWRALSNLHSPKAPSHQSSSPECFVFRLKIKLNFSIQFHF